MTFYALLNILTILLLFIGFSSDYLYRVYLKAVKRETQREDKIHRDFITSVPKQKYNRHEVERKRWAMNIDSWLTYGGIDDPQWQKRYIDDHIRQAWIKILEDVEIEQAYSVQFRQPVLMDRQGNRTPYPFAFPITTDVPNIDILHQRQLFDDFRLYVQVDIQKQNTIEDYHYVYDDNP